MKLTKLLLCIALTLSLLLGLCACASQEKITVPKETPAATEEPTTEEPTTEEPTTEEPTTEEPTTEEPTTEEPAVAFDSPYAESIVGAWDWEIDMSKLMVETLSKSMGMDLGEKGAELKFAFTFTFEFAADGTCKAYFDEDKLSTTLDTFIADFCVVLTEITYDTVAAQGVSREDADANFASQYGCGIEEYYNQIMSESIDLTALFGQLPTIDTTYKLEGDQLTLAVNGVYNDDAAAISIDGDVMTIDGYIDPSIEAQFSSLGLELPLTLIRK